MSSTRPAFAVALVLLVLLGLSSPASGQSCIATVSVGPMVGADGGIQRVTIDVEPDSCTWTTTLDNGSASVWRRFPIPALNVYQGDGYLDVSFGPNRNPGARFIPFDVVADGTFATGGVAAQEPFSGCINSVASPAKPSPVPSEGGTFVVNAYQYNEWIPSIPCGWRASSDSDWLTIPPDAWGGPSGSFLATVLPNAGAYSRSGTIRVGAASLNVMQAGRRPVRNVELGGGAGADAVLYDPATGRYDAMSLKPGTASARLDYFRWAQDQAVEPGDFNGDGLTDFLVYSPGDGSCEMDLARSLSATSPELFEPWDCGIGPLNARPTIFDANGDGRSDVLLYDEVSGQWTLKLARDVEHLGGTVYEDAASGLWAGGWRITAAQFDDDGRDDLFLYNANPAHPYGGMWFRVFSRDNATFEYAPGDLRWAAGWSIVPGDFDGDGITELFLHGYANLGLWFIVDFTGDGASTYAGGVWAAGWEIHPAHFNDDNRTDLFLYMKGPGPLAGLWFRAVSNGASGFDYFTDMRWAAGWRVSVGDIDADGLSDVFLDGRNDSLAALVLTRDGGAASSYTYDTAWPAAPRIFLSRMITP